MKPRLPLPHPRKTRRLPKDRAGTPPRKRPGGGRAPSTPLSSAPRPPQSPSRDHSPPQDPARDGEGSEASTAEPHPARRPEAVPPRTRPGFVTGLRGHRLKELSGTAEPSGKRSP
ncbi:serine/arginine-rich splicing factor SR45-like [Cebus imitator]|uniref:serine/arginine-rich splicing factor SR45-like n=1 Tax=Cebus imitator TaxID=2715852 RepID=UPI00080A09F9|nr:serine/arginine-rich splicing factor SR45-like [Cebus imitator]